MAIQSRRLMAQAQGRREMAAMEGQEADAPEEVEGREALSSSSSSDEDEDEDEDEEEGGDGGGGDEDEDEGGGQEERQEAATGGSGARGGAAPDPARGVADTARGKRPPRSTWASRARANAHAVGLVRVCSWAGREHTKTGEWVLVVQTLTLEHAKNAYNIMLDRVMDQTTRTRYQNAVGQR